MRVAAAQVNPVLGRLDENLAKSIDYLREAANHGVELLVFPEAALTGYVFESAEETRAASVTVPGEATDRLMEESALSRVSVVFGLVERDGDRVYNSTVLIDPSGLIGTYRKTHTLCLGLDRFVSTGDSLGVFRTAGWVVGMLICYDQRFPETARTLALKGADILCHSTNLPQGTDVYQNLLNPARACENRVFVISAARVGKERGVTFSGRSQIIDCLGQVVAEGSRTNEELLVVDIDPLAARLKHIVKVPGEYEMDLLNDRRPDLYQEVGRAKGDQNEVS